MNAIKTKITKTRCKTKVGVSWNNHKRKKNVKLWRERVKKMNVVIEKPVVLAPMARMKQMAQEAMKAKGLTGKDIRRMIGIERYEQED